MDGISLKNVIILYLIISANFLPNTFSCTLQRMLNESMYYKHIAGYLTLLYFVLLGTNTPSADGLQFFKTMFKSVFLYIIFMFSTKMNKAFTYIFLSCCVSYFILQLYKESLDEKAFADRITILGITNNMIAVFALLFLTLGVLFYFNEKRNEYSTNFSPLIFIFGKTSCKTTTKTL